MLLALFHFNFRKGNSKTVKNFFDKKNRKTAKLKKTVPNQSDFNIPTMNLKKNQDIIKKIKQKKNKKRARILLAIKIAALALALFFGFKIFSVVSKFNKKLNLSDIGLSEHDEAAERQLSNITNILLLGIDDNNISDTIMIASIDKLNKKLKLISIARDSLVSIENPKTKKTFYSKVNEAYALGGESTTIKTLNKNFQIRLMDYITINFEGLVDVIDELNGVDLEISKKESRDIDGIINSTKSLKQKNFEKLNGRFGKVHLNGAQAVAYVRIRKTETLNGLNDDFGRTYRQRLVMNLVFKKIMNLNKANVPKLINTLLPYIKTSLSFKSIFNIYSCVRNNNFNFEPTQIPLPAYIINPDYTYNSKSTVFYDLDYAGKIINSIIYDDVDQKSFIENNPPNIKKMQINEERNSKNANKEKPSNKNLYNSKSKNNSNSKIQPKKLLKKQTSFKHSQT